ncbi:MAG TPA: DUF542 domain-containing protein [Thermoanaerobaculia bacterium]|nr:DUF542 domain-containing protein [Thermoanaerobaculia bacterium]
MDTTPIDPSTPVRDLLRRHPHLSSALAARGLDACCGGVHPLKDACTAKGLDLEEVVADLESAHAAAEAHSIVPPTTSVREVLRRFPATRPVLERWGLADCGGAEGPDEPLAWFATVHRLPLDEFLRDVRAAAVRNAVTAPAPTPAAPSPFSPHFILGSLLLTLTLGATTGMINLLRIASGADVPIDHRQIHGHMQVLGFATLFLMGIAFHALPRILGIGSPASHRGARATFWLMFAGVLLRNLGQPFGSYAFGRLASLLSAACELAAGVLFIRFVFSLLGRASAGKYGRRDPLIVFVGAGTGFFALAIGLAAAQGTWLAGHLDTVLPASLNEPFYFAALYGFLLAWVYGFGHRVVSLFLGVGAPVRGTTGLALATQVCGVALALASWLPAISDRLALGLRDGGLSFVAISALLYLGGNGFVWRRAKLPMLRTPGAPTVAIRMAFGFLGLWALLELAAVVLSRLTPIPAQNLWWADAARHVFTIGFLTLLIVGMSFRILPVFSGKTLWSPRLAHVTYGLIALGVALRLLQYPAAFEPFFYRIGSFMGVFVVLALVLFLVNLVRTMRANPRRRQPAAAPAMSPRFASTLPVR